MSVENENEVHMNGQDANYTSNVTDADAIFIPSNLSEDLKDYKEYKAKFYRKVPANCYLVRQSRINNSMVNLGIGGLKFMKPLVSKSIFVPAIDRTINYRPIKYTTKEGITVNVDMALTVKIVDPVKYLNYGKMNLDQLNQITQNLLMTYIHNNYYETLAGGGLCPVERFSPKGVDVFTGLQMASPFEQFEERYGIQVKKVHLGKVTLPKNLQEQYDNKVEAEKRKEAQAVDLAAEEEKAASRARVVQLEAQAEADKIRVVESAKYDVDLEKKQKLFEYLRKEGFSADDFREYLKFQEMSKNQNSAFFYGANDAVKDISSGVAVANRYTQKKTEDVRNGSVNGSVPHETGMNYNQTSNSKRLLNALMLKVVSGEFSRESYDEVVGLLQDQATVQRIDSLDQGGYQELLNEFLASERSATNTSPNVRKR